MASFKTNNNWELKGIDRMFADSNERLYPFVETVSPGNYFIIDSLQKIESDEVDGVEELSRRFFLSDTLGALAFICNGSKQGLEYTGVALLQGANLSDDNDYNSSSIDEIILCEDAMGQNAFVYKLKNGKRVLDSMLAGSEEEIELKSTLYENKELTNHALDILKKT